MKHLNKEHGYDYLCRWIVHIQVLLTCISFESCDTFSIITLFKVTELRKRAAKEEKVSIEVAKREPPAVKGILCFD